MGEVIFDNIQQRIIDSLLMKNTEALTQCDRPMKALIGRVAQCQSVITPLTVHVKRHMIKIEEKHSLVRRLQQQFLKATYQPSLAMPMLEPRVVTSPTGTPSGTDSDEKRRRRREPRTGFHNESSHTRSTLPEVGKQEKLNSKSRKAPILEKTQLVGSWSS